MAQVAELRLQLEGRDGGLQRDLPRRSPPTREFNKFGEFSGWAKAQGKHSNIGYDAPKGLDRDQVQDPARHRDDPRISTAEMQVYTLEETNATTTQDAGERGQATGRRTARGHPAGQGARALADLGAQRRRRPRRGLADHRPPSILGQSGTAWQIFPNFQIGQGLTTALCYSARPDRLRPRQVHLRGRGVRAVPRRAKSRRPNGCTRRPRTRTGARCSRRTSPTWPPSSRA